MKTIKILKILINILYMLLLAVLAIAVLFLIMLAFFDDSLPFYLRGYRMFFSSFFSWKLFLVPFVTCLNYILFVLSIFYLRKCINPFIDSEFYTTDVYKNLRKSGWLFIFIGASTILVMLISAIYVQEIMNNMIQFNTLISYLSMFPAATDLKSVFLIIIGLFFLLFSKSFENAKKLQLENDLTI